MHWRITGPPLAVILRLTKRRGRGTLGTDRQGIRDEPNNPVIPIVRAIRRVAHSDVTRRPSPYQFFLLLHGAVFASLPLLFGVSSPSQVFHNTLRSLQLDRP